MWRGRDERGALCVCYCVGLFIRCELIFINIVQRTILISDCLCKFIHNAHSHVIAV